MRAGWRVAHRPIARRTIAHRPSLAAPSLVATIGILAPAKCRVFSGIFSLLGPANHLPTAVISKKRICVETLPVEACKEGEIAQGKKRPPACLAAFGPGGKAVCKARGQIYYKWIQKVAY